MDRLIEVGTEYFSASSFYYLHSHERIIFFAVYLLIYVVSVFGNIAVIITMLKRNQRYIQKSCLISLSVSDFITATANAIMHLSTFVQELKIWTLGSFMCSFLPLLPIFGTICSSAVLVGIAYDRYQNVVNAVKTRWQPSLRQCIIGFSILWICSAGISYPMYTYFKLLPVNIIFLDEETHIPIDVKSSYTCLSNAKHQMMVYYICLMCILFIPMLFIYLWLYIKIAQLIWNHRKPVSDTAMKKVENPTIDTSTMQSKGSESNSKTSASNATNSRRTVKKEKMRVERKMRTFKIIVFLMCVFLMLRLPNLIFDTMKLSISLTGHEAWLAKYICSALTLLSCALNPFLYTFLNNSIQLLKRSKNFVYHICCFCLYTNEFDEFQNGHPFIQKSYEKHTNESGTSTQKTPKVKGSVTFDDIANVQLYSPEGNSSLREKQCNKF